MECNKRYNDLAVLVVDDEQVVRRICQKILQNKPYGVLVLDDPREALSVIKGEKPDVLGGRDIAVLLTDNNMPNMKGEQLIEQAMYNIPDATFMMMSALPQPEDCLIDHYLSKPFRNGDLSEAVDRAVEQYLQRLGRNTD